MKKKKSVKILCCVVAMLVLVVVSVGVTLLVSRHSSKTTVVTNQNEDKNETEEENEDKNETLSEEEIKEQKEEIVKEQAQKELSNMGYTFLSNQLSYGIIVEDDYVEVMINNTAATDDYKRFRFIYKDVDVKEKTCRLYKLTAAKDYTGFEDVIYKSKE